MIDNTDIAAAALAPTGVARCNCARHTRSNRPNPKCQKCKGSGKVKACQPCEGSGWNREKQMKCERCEGKGFVTSS